jgi:chloramphenicol-sensitive protein RarD
MKKGVWYALAAYVIWGLFPIYWKGLHQVPAVQLLGHRITWSFVLLFLVVAFTRRSRAFRAIAFKPRVLLIYFVAAVLIGLNWFTYLLAVNSGFVVESSLGYFINPLISVPWFAVMLALSFGLYGLVKKTAPLGSLDGMMLETGLMFLPAVLYLIYTEVTHQGAFLHTSPTTTALLIGGGLVTTMPLLLFGSAVQRIPLALVGVLQYINPTLQFLLGTLVYHEPFSVAQFIGFGIVWAALILYGVEGLIAFRDQRAAAAAVAAN